MKLSNNEHVGSDHAHWKVTGLLVSLALAVVIVGMAFPFRSRTTPPASPAVQTAGAVAVSAWVGDDALLQVSVDAAAASTAFDALKAATAARAVEVEYKEYPGMGVLVTRIGDKENGEGGAYWQYWVNGSYAQVAADQMAVRPGDRVEWKFTDSRQ